MHGVLVAAVLLAGAPARAEVVDRLVAVVGDRPLMLSDVRAAIDLRLVEPSPEADADRHAVGWLIDRTLMLEEVDRYGPGEPDPQRVGERVESLRRQLGPGGLETVLARHGLDEVKLRAWLRDQLRIERYLTQRFGAAAQPTDEEVLAFYRRDPGAYTSEGAPLPLERALEVARLRFTAERRAGMVSDWLESLRRRTDIVVRYPAPVTP